MRAAAPARRVLCALAARAVELRSWSRLGFARAGDQTRERLGLSARSLQELARVHRVLAEAPGVDAAFRAGGIRWTAVRALARLERIEDPALWLERAKALPACELERAVRRARAERDGAPPGKAAQTGDADEAPDARVPVACTRLARAKWSLGRELARRVAGGRLPRWECAEVVAAETTAAVPLAGEGPFDLDEEARPGTWLGGVVASPRPAGEDAGEPAETCVGSERAPGAAADPSAGRAGADRNGSGAEPATAASADPPPLSPELASLLDGLAEADAFEVDRRLRRVLRHEWTHEARLGPLLRGVLEGRLYRWRGYWDRDRYLEERLGMCPRKARALVRIERTFERAPALAGAWRTGRLSWVRAQALAPLVEAGLAPAHARAWVRRAERITVRRLEDDVRGALALADLEPGAFQRTGGVPEDVCATHGTRDGMRGDGPARRGLCNAPAQCAKHGTRDGAKDNPGDRQIGAGPSRRPEGAPRGASLRERIQQEQARREHTRREPARQIRARRGRSDTDPRSSAEPGSARNEDATVEFWAPPESARFFRGVLQQVRRRLADARGAPVTEGEAFEAMLDHAIHTWSERDDRARRDLRIFERDGWRCAVPGCSSHRNLQVHHVVFRSHGGGDEPENLVTLCAWHHQRGVHGGRIRITGRAPGRLCFELGLREGKPPYLVYDSEERIIE